MIAAAEFRSVLGHFATGVAVVTAADGAGGLAGLTLNAFTAVSLDPPLVLACLDRCSRTYAALLRQRRFAVHILTAEQDQVARAFAQPSADKSSICGWHLDAEGFVRLDRCQAFIACHLHREVDGGDHAILIGAVASLAVHDAATPPLLFYRGRLGQMTP